MLKELKIENYAIIDDLEIDFSEGLNTITGETGAGKSILLGALGLLSGGRAEAAAFADNERNCIIEAVFTVGEVKEFLAQNDIDCPADEVIIRRTISPTGRSRAFVNDEPVSLSLLRDLSDMIVDIHSQHQTLLLAHADFQTRIIDSISGYSIETYRELYRSLRVAQKELKLLREQSEQGKRRAEFLEFQIEQIAQAAIKPAEVAQMEARAKILANATEIAGALGYVAGAMNGDESGVVVALKNSLQTVNKIKENYPKSQEYAERLNSLYLEAKDLVGEIEAAGENIEINPSELQAIEERLDTIYTLMQKHSADTAEQLLEFCEQMQTELDELVDVETKIEKLELLIAQTKDKASAQADKISKNRRAVAPKIEKEIVATLKELGIKDAVFTITMGDAAEFTSTGRDTISVLFSGNAGKAPQPIESVASGGEMSRVMLAIKGIMSRTTQLPTIIFDEIDAGVSGVVAHKMGEIIAQMGQKMQVLNITHLPQVASKGDSHFLVYKDNKGTHIRRLNREERIDHIAAMLSGSIVTEAARTQAIELING